MKCKSILPFLFLQLIILSSFGQQNNSTNTYDFDKIRATLKSENNPEAEKIKLWILKNITFNHPSSLYTKECYEFLSEIPDDITLGLEEVPGTIGKEFKQKWGSKFDMNRLIFSPFELGNGGCEKIQLINLKFIGSISGEFYYNVSVYCNNDKNNMNKLVLVILQNNGKYLINNVMSQEKHDYLNAFLH